uniref:UPAR/Ly6 domain-containing protein n=1 Tax=Pseudonaja textilis TaxID=8673 RepID=A0A670ZVT6_PSETE
MHGARPPLLFSQRCWLSWPGSPYDKIFLSSLAGGSLWCYTCRTQLKTDNCKRAVFCKEKAKVCKTDVISLMGLLHIISKQCASSCTTYHKDIAILKRNISCCTTDLCNQSDGTRENTLSTSTCLGKID